MVKSQFALTSEQKRRILEGESYDPNAAAPPSRNVPVEPFGELSAPTPGIRDAIYGGALDLGLGAGLEPWQARKLAGLAGGGAELVPGVGETIGAATAKEELAKGNYGLAALEAAGLLAGAVPVVGDLAAQGLRSGGRRALRAFGTHEMTPGRQTGHLPGIAYGDQATRDAFAAEPGSWWRGPGDRDILYESQGVPTGPSVTGHGVYGSPVQFNPMEAGRPSVALSGPRGERVVDPASRDMMTGTEGFRAYMDAQDMGAWSVPLGRQDAALNNAYELALPTSAPTRDELADIMRIGGEHGMGDIVHYGGPRALLTEFYPGRTGIGDEQANAINAALVGRATATPTRRASDYVDYEAAWRGGVPEGDPLKQGSDLATTKMLDKLTPAQLEAFERPEVRAKVLERFDRDARVALERGDVVREDLQRARKLFAEGGFKALRENLNRGLLPAAAVGLFLHRSRDDEAG